MKGVILLILGIIAVIVVVGGVAAVHVMHEAGIEDISADSVKTLKVQVHPQVPLQVQVLHQIQEMSWML